MSIESMIFLVAFLPIILFFLVLFIRTVQNAYEKRQVPQNCQETVLGEIVGTECRNEEGAYVQYSPRVSYTVGGCTYQVDANAYSCDEPVIGQKVYVRYNPDNPAEMYLTGVYREETDVVKLAKQPSPWKAWWKARKYHSEVVGEVVRVQTCKIEEYILTTRRNPWLLIPMEEQREYNTVVQYKVLDTVYEINAGEYSECLPMVGRRAMVLCSIHNPEEACVATWKSYKKPLQVRRRDDEFLYCTHGWRTNVKVPVEKVEEGVKPGHLIVYRYGFYHLQQPEDKTKTYLEFMADLASKRF